MHFARRLQPRVYPGLLLLCIAFAFGCSKNGGFENPFSTTKAASSDRTLSGSPAQQVAQLEQWRREAELEVKQLREGVAGLTEKNQTLQTQIANAQRQMQLQSQHLKSVSDRLAATTSELAQTQMQKQGSSQNAASLNALNQEKERQLAASRQTVQKLQQELKESTEQLQTTQSELVQSEARAKSAQQSVEHLTASSRQRGSATIRPNQNLKLITLPAEEGTIERDGNVIRVQMPAKNIFNPQTAQIQDGKIATLKSLGKRLSTAYPDQRIGLEGHASSNQDTQGVWRNGHHLSSAQAMSIYEFFLTQSIFSSDQMFIVGHGANHPVFSSATEIGRSGNDRVEIVIYPDAVR